jgi:uncharacterized protein (TIGR00725 family)
MSAEPGAAGDLVIGVVGPGRADPGLQQMAEAAGRAIARAGARLVTGGLGGCMEAACRGAKGAGGRTVGILPGTERRAGNPYLDVAIPTGLGEGRNLLVVRTADALVAVGGEYGTLSEIAFALKIGRPVVGLGTWELRRRGAVDAGIRLAEDPNAAVALALDLARHSSGSPGGRPTQQRGQV